MGEREVPRCTSAYCAVNTENSKQELQYYGFNDEDRIFVLNGTWTLSMKPSTRTGSLTTYIRKYTRKRPPAFHSPSKAPQTATEQKTGLSSQHFQERATLPVQTESSFLLTPIKKLTVTEEAVDC